METQTLVEDPSRQAGPSKSTTSPRRSEIILKDEEKYQAMQYQSVDDVPGCMRLLDEFLMCYALVPQIRNMYRHGELRDCTHKLQDFKYCLSLRGETEDAKRQLWIKRRAAWWASRRLEGSSEDVWDLRTEKLVNFPPVHPSDVEEETATIE